MNADKPCQKPYQVVAFARRDRHYRPQFAWDRRLGAWAFEQINNGVVKGVLWAR